MTTILLAVCAACTAFAVFDLLERLVGRWEERRDRGKLERILRPKGTVAFPAGMRPAGPRFLQRLLETRLLSPYRDLLSDWARRASSPVTPFLVLRSQAAAGLGAGVLFAVMTGSLPAALAAFAAGMSFPALRLHERALTRERLVLAALPDALEGYALCAEAGLTLEQAMEQHQRGAGEGPWRDEAGKVLRETGAGSSRREALAALRERLDLPDVSLFVTTVVNAERTGSAVAAALRRLSLILRDKQVQRSERAAQEMPVRLLLPLVLCILPVTFLVLFGPVVLQWLR